MARCKTPSFALTIPLKITGLDRSALESKFEAGRQIVNGVLDEALSRADAMKQSKKYQAACKIPKTKEGKKLRKEAFKAICQEFGFREYDLTSFVLEMRNDSHWLGAHLGSHEAQALAKRVFKSVARYVYGKGGRPRFKAKRGIHSIEAKTNKSNIRFADGRILWMKLDLPLILDPESEFQKEALESRTKYVRIVRRRIKGVDLYFAQLIQEGKSPLAKKRKLGTSTTCADLGPSTVAEVTRAGYFLKSEFAPFISPTAERVAEIQRQINRSLRLNNPDCYDSKGAVIKGSRFKNVSKSVKKLRDQAGEVNRKLADERVRSHGQLANEILSRSETIILEKLSYKGWQKNFGKSVARKGPGLFVSILKRKAESAGASFIEIPAGALRLSQYCHVREDFLKKPLSQRYHEFPDGTRVDRDLYSAWLGAWAIVTIDPKTDLPEYTLDVDRLAESWLSAGMGSYLLAEYDCGHHGYNQKLLQGT